jgi:RND family efflux transporter MFP subunit
MTRSTLFVTVAAVAVAGGLIATILWRHGHPAGGDSDADPTPTAQITVASLQSKPLTQTLTLYGDVEADPTAVVSLAAPRAVVVSRVLVHPGQTVAAGQALIELAGAPDAELAYRQAADTAAFAQADLDRVQRLYDGKLAASDQLIAAKKAAAEAQATLASLQKQRGGGALQTLTAPRAAIVTKVAASPGDHVAQDGALLSLAAADGLVAQLSLEPTEHRVSAGAAVTLKSPTGGTAIASHISLVGRAPNPDSKLLTASAPLKGSSLAVGSAIQGDIATGGHTGLTAPRASVVFDETGAHLFTVTGGKAHRVFVIVGADQGDEVEVSGLIKAGDVVAVEGAYELQDGMAVKVHAASVPAPKAADE